MNTLLRRCLQHHTLRLALVWATVFLLGQTATAQSQIKEGLVQNPHGDSTGCAACHDVSEQGKRILRFEGQLTRLCTSCHDGQQARAALHPVDGKPSQDLASHWPTDFPLTDQRITCLTCHDVRRTCRAQPPRDTDDPYFLRGPQVANRLEFCFLCHPSEPYRPFNVHDQLEGDQLKTDTCLWCHVQVPDRLAHALEGSPYTLLSTPLGSCNSCHPVADDHPIGKTIHMHVTPSTEFRIYMAAYEMTTKMRLPLDRLMDYVRATGRPPRAIPLDEQGRITCYSCHNPHERGVLPSNSPRAAGADDKHARHHRVRIASGDVCIACHQK